MNIIEETKIKFKRMIDSQKCFLFDYVESVKDCSFEDLPFNIVDSLIFSIISYFRFDFMTSKANKKLKLFEAASIYDLNEDLKNSSSNSLRNPFLKLLSSSKRYKDLELFNFQRVHSIAHEEQFSAIAIKINNQTVYVSFSGTDSTLTGIKEDMNMTYLTKIPSQDRAAKYINERCFKKFKNIYIGGHSKGGNLSIYAGMHLNKKRQKRIKKIFNFDGPGFSKALLEKENYEEIFNKVITIVPEMSVFGMIWNNPADIVVIESNNISIMQHDPFSRKIDDMNHFVYKNYVSKTSLALNNSVKTYFEELDKDQRRHFVDLVWYFTKDLPVKKLSDLKKNILKNSLNTLLLYKDLDKNSKNILNEHLKIFIKSLIVSARTLEDPQTQIRPELIESFNHFDI